MIPGIVYRIERLQLRTPGIRPVARPIVAINIPAIRMAIF
jgi:hypothetical protein